MSTRYYVPIDTFAINNLVSADCQENPGTIPLGRNMVEVSQAILLFDVNPLLALAEINTAELFMQVHSQVDVGLNKTFGIYRIIQNWIPEPVCPGDPPVFDPTPVATFDVTSGVVDINVDIKSLVLEWIEDTDRNFGLLIKAVDEVIPFTEFRIYSIGYSNSTRWPAIKVDLVANPVEITGSLTPLTQVLSDAPIVTSDDFEFSTPRQFGLAFFSTFFVKNTGTSDATVKIQISDDDVNYVDDGIEMIVPSGELITLLAETYGNYCRVAYKSTFPLTPTTLEIDYVAKLN